MHTNLYKNLANLVVLLRIILIFVVLFLMSVNNAAYRITALLLLLFTISLDFLDGYIARKLKTTSQIGALLDTLGDRITENLLIVFVAYMRLIPFAIAALFVSRSFIADFIRGLNFKKGIGTFQINKTRLGIIFVSSAESRVLYLLSKLLLFVFACLILILKSPGINVQPELITQLKAFLFYIAIFVLAFNLVRFVLLLYDSRDILKENFLHDS